MLYFFFFKQKTAYEMRISDWSSDVCSSDLPTREILPHAEALIEATGADFRIGGSEAFYSPGGDFVAVPPQPAFRDQINFYRTAFHELSHWTGHAKRLGRDQSGRFGSKPYAREELCAEISAAFICAALGIVPTVRHADYVGSDRKSPRLN